MCNKRNQLRRALFLLRLRYLSLPRLLVERPKRTIAPPPGAFKHIQIEKEKEKKERFSTHCRFFRRFVLVRVAFSTPEHQSLRQQLAVLDGANYQSDGMFSFDSQSGLCIASTSARLKSTRLFRSAFFHARWLGSSSSRSAGCWACRAAAASRGSKQTAKRRAISFIKRILFKRKQRNNSLLSGI